MDRLLRVRQIMREQGLSQLIVTQPQSIYYLTGCWVNPMDRLDALVIRESELCFLCYVLAVAYPENAKTVIYDDMGQAIPELCKLLEAAPTGVDEEMPARYALALQQAMPELNIRPAACVELARMCKDEEEIRRLEYASQVTDLVFQEAFPQLREGMTEIEFGQVFSQLFEDHGVGRFFGNPLVAFGASAADPHHSPGETRLKWGDCVLVDTGKRINGYFSDTTRTVFFGECSAQQREIYDIVLRANAAGIAAVRPGIDFREVDRAARRVIQEAGYGAQFFHKTSHGVGIDCHERPADRQDAAYILREGMAFSVEPGIYLEGKLGIRIEDLIIVTDRGANVATHCPKELQVIKPQ